MVHFESNAPGLKVIVAYKLVKGLGLLALGLVLLREHLLGRVEDFAFEVGTWITQLDFLDGYGDRLGSWIQHVVTPKHIHLAIALMLVDAVSTTIEGVGLHYRQRWAAWLVVLATGALVPLELWGLYRHVTALRILALVINLAIVAYLVVRVLHHQRQLASPTV